MREKDRITALDEYYECEIEALKKENRQLRKDINFLMSRFFALQRVWQGWKNDTEKKLKLDEVE